MPTLRYVVVDVFTDTPLTGNQLAVFTDARAIDSAVMQALANEVGFSESTFVLPAEQGGPRGSGSSTDEEMPFAGHLGSRHRLGAGRAASTHGHRAGDRRRGGSRRDRSRRVGLARVRPHGPGRSRRSAQSRTPRRCSRRRSAGPGALAELYDNGATHIVVTLDSDAALAALSPDPSAIAGFGVTGVNCISGTGGRWKNRMFWPRGEDAATGSAVGPIARHACRHGRAEWGEWIQISQGVEIGRPSTLFARADGAAGIDAVVVEVEPVVARGEFRLGEMRGAA